jgi:hypothetical protein
MPMLDRPSGFRLRGACRGGDRVFLGGVAWLISIRPSHDFEGDADVAQNGAGKLEKEADCAGAFAGWDLHPLESAATAHTPNADAGTRLSLRLSIK